MIWKIIGTILLAGAGGYLSLALVRLDERRLRVLDGYIALILYIRGQIDSFAMPFGEILRQADERVLAACCGVERVNRPLLETRLHRALWDGERPFSVLVTESRPYLVPEAERLLTAFSGEIGGACRAEQVSRCTYYMEALTRERNRLREALTSRARTQSVLVICATVGAAVLLW